MIIKNKNFTLRPYRKGDEFSLQKNINDKSIYRYTLRIPFPYTLKDAKKWIGECINALKKKKKEKIVFAIEIGGEVVGGVGFHNIEKHRAEIGYWLCKKYWNRNIVTNVVKIMTKIGFNKLK